MSEIRNQLQTLTGAEITGAQISTVGGKVFTNANKSQGDLVELVNFWRVVHVPAYGQPIPGSAKTATGDLTSPNVLVPASNTSAYLTAMSVTNGSSTDPATFTLTIGGAAVFVGPVDPNTTVTVIGSGAIQPGVIVVDGQTVAASQTGTTDANVSYALAYSLVVQG